MTTDAEFENQVMELAEDLVEVCNEHNGDVLVTTGALAISLISIAQQGGIPKKDFIRAFTKQVDRMYQQDGRVMQ